MVKLAYTSSEPAATRLEADAYGLHLELGWFQTGAVIEAREESRERSEESRELANSEWSDTARVSAVQILLDDGR